MYIYIYKRNKIFTTNILLTEYAITSFMVWIVKNWTKLKSPGGRKTRIQNSEANESHWS